MSTEHDEMSRRVEVLCAFEREYRTRMSLYLEDCLATVQAPEDGHPLRVAARRLADASDADLLEVLADLPERQRQRFLTVLRVPVAEVDQ